MKVQTCSKCGQIIKKAGKPRTTGYRSQNHRIRGFCASISEQVIQINPAWIPGAVHDLMKMLAVEEGVWPVLEVKDKKCQSFKLPLSEAFATVEQAGGLITVIQEFADRHGFWLWEYDEIGQRFKSLGGRTHREMIEYEQQHGKIT